MTYEAELQRERAHLLQIQQLLYEVIHRSKSHADFQSDTIRMMLEDAWGELRMRPTALSPQDIEQLNAEIDRFLIRKSFSEDNAARYERMLMRPYFARIDFKEAGEAQYDEIVIGLYSLKDTKGALLVHDWRAPVCSLYYDSLPGEVVYHSPSGAIRGHMSLKRQYGIEEGRLKYYVDTEYAIEDDILLNILSGSTNPRMKQIVSTIQSEQNAAIRHDGAQVLSVVGGAGSGKTSVALHRAAYLMYQQRDVLTADAIMVISPSASFSGYIADVLPELGEHNTRHTTLHELATALIGQKVEPPSEQVEALLTGDRTIRIDGVRKKTEMPFIDVLDSFAEDFRARGPVFENISMKRHQLASKREFEQLYREDFKMLTPAQRLTRLQTIVDDRLAEWERTLLPQYREQLNASYQGKELDFVSQMAVKQQLHPFRQLIKKMLAPDPLALYAEALRGWDEDQAKIALENAAVGRIDWEDAPGIAYLLLRLGFVKPDTSIRHLIIDEAQDYSDIALRFLRQYYPWARATILGDPNQRTLPGMEPCDPGRWGALMEAPKSPLLTLSRVYRSTYEITEFCNAILNDQNAPMPFGRHGEPPVRATFSMDALKALIDQWSKKYHRLAIITGNRADTKAISRHFKGAAELTDHDDALDGTKQLTIASYHFLKGLEFDAVAVVWSEEGDTPDARRRLYTACSRALHELRLFEGRAAK